MVPSEMPVQFVLVHEPGLAELALRVAAVGGVVGIALAAVGGQVGAGVQAALVGEDLVKKELKLEN